MWTAPRKVFNFISLYLAVFSITYLTFLSLLLIDCWEETPDQGNSSKWFNWGLAYGFRRIDSPWLPWQEAVRHDSRVLDKSFTSWSTGKDRDWAWRGLLNPQSISHSDTPLQQSHTYSFPNNCTSLELSIKIQWAHGTILIQITTFSSLVPIGF